MTLTLIPDIEKIVANFVRSHAAIQALGARVVARTPDDTDEAWIRVTPLSADNDPNSPVDWLIGSLVQFDCYVGEGEGPPQANLLARTLRAVLPELQDASLDAVVTSVTFVGQARIPDTEFKPARERVVLTARIYAHV